MVRMHHIVFAAVVLALSTMAFVHPPSLVYAAIGALVATFTWVYFSLRRPGGTQGDSRYGGSLLVALVAIGTLVMINSPAARQKASRAWSRIASRRPNA